MKRLALCRAGPIEPTMVTLESIEDPSDVKPDDDEKVKTAPGQSIEAEWDICLYNTERGGRVFH